MRANRFQPNPAPSAKPCAKREASTISFFGTQPRITQVPPTRYSSANATRAPCCAATRAARTPPEPPPMTNRSTSCITNPDQPFATA